MSEPSHQNPHVFIVGCPRSGTTLLQRVVNAHSRIVVVPEIHWVTGQFWKTSQPMSAAVTSEVMAGFMEHERFRDLGVDQNAFQGLVGPGEAVTCAEFLDRLFELYRKIHNKPYVGNKTPQYLQHIPLLHSVWGRTKFVHIIRDGRDVCLSIMSWKKGARAAGRFAGWKEDPVSTTAFWWKRTVLLGRDGGSVVGPDLYYEVLYEHLVTRPAQECAKLCAFLDLPYEESMVRFYESKKATDPRPRAKSWLPITAGLRDWRTQMQPDDVERFEAAAGDLLENLDYPRVFAPPASRRIDHASRMLALFTEGVQAAGKTLPQGWLTEASS
jgi:hypothetical protein